MASLDQGLPIQPPQAMVPNLGPAPSKPRVKPQIPSLGPNLGKLGFTDLKPDSNDERKEEIGPVQAIDEQAPSEAPSTN